MRSFVGSCVGVGPCVFGFSYISISTIQQSSKRLWSQVSRRRGAGRGGDLLCIQALQEAVHTQTPGKEKPETTRRPTFIILS